MTEIKRPSFLPSPEYWANFLSESRRDFVGREALFTEIELWLQKDATTIWLLLTGGPGTGKSAIVAELVHRNHADQVLAYHCCREDQPETLNPMWFVRNLAGQLSERVLGFAAQLETKAARAAFAEGVNTVAPEKAFRQGILAPLAALKKNVPGYFLIDGLATSQYQDSILQVLNLSSRSFPRWLRLLVTSRARGSDLFYSPDRSFREIRLNKRCNLKDMETYIHDRFFPVGKRGQEGLAAKLLQQGAATPAAMQFLKKQADGNFLYLRQLLDGLADDVYTYEQVRAMPLGMYGIFQAHFANHFPIKAGAPVGYDNAKTVLALLLTARAPLTDAELLSITNLTPAKLRQIWNQIGNFVPNRGRGRVSYGSAFTEWLHDSANNPHYAVSTAVAHLLFSDAAIQLLREQGELEGYLLFHAAYHMAVCEQWDHWATMMTSFSCLEKRVSAAAIEGITQDWADFEEMPNHHPMYELLGSLRAILLADDGRFSTSQQDFFQRLYNRAWWHDHASAAQHYHLSAQTEAANQYAWQRPGPKLSALVERWRQEKSLRDPGFVWLRALRPLPERPQQLFHKEFDINRRQVKTLAFSPDSTRFLTTTSAGIVAAWDILSGEQIVDFRADSGNFYCSCWSPGSTKIAAGGSSNKIQIGDTRTQEWLLTLEGHSQEILSIAWSPDGTRLASTCSSKDFTVGVWDARSGQQLLGIQGHKAPVHSVCWSPDGTRLATASDDQTVRVWNARHGLPLHLLEGHTLGVHSVRWAPDGSRLVSASKNEILVWDARTGGQILQLQQYAESVECVCWAPDSSRVLSGYEDGKLRIWNILNGSVDICIQAHGNAVTSVDWAPNGVYLLSGSFGDSIKLWSGFDSPIRSSLERHKGDVTAVRWAPDSSLLATGASDGTIYVWNSTTGVCNRKFHFFDQPILMIAWSGDGRYLAATAVGTPARVWDVETGNPLTHDLKHLSNVERLSWAPNDLRLAGMDSEGILHVWDVRRGRLLWEREKAGVQPHCVVWSPDGTKLAAMGKDPWIMVWNAANGLLLYNFSIEPASGMFLRWAPDSKHLSCIVDGCVEWQWAMKSGKLLVRNLQMRGAILDKYAPSTDPGSAFLPAMGSEDLPASARYQVWSSDGTLVCLRASDHEPVAWFETGKPGAAISPNGRKIAVPNDNQLVMLQIEEG